MSEQRPWKDRVYSDRYQHWIGECLCGFTCDGYFTPVFDAVKAHIATCEVSRKAYEEEKAA